MALDSGYLERAAPPGSAAYFQVLFAAPEHRPALRALFALRSEIGRAVAQPGEPAVARFRLAWWQEELARLCQRQSRHPVTQELSRAAPFLADEFDFLNDLLDAAASDLEGTAYKTIEALAEYARSSMAPVYRLAASLEPRADRESQLRAADELGCGVRLTEIVANVKQDAIDERIYLPLERLEHDDARALLDGVVRPEIEPALRVTHAAAGSRLAAARAMFRDTPCDRASAVALEWHTELLAVAQRRDFKVAGPRIDLRPLKKVYVSWRAASRAARRSLSNGNGP